MILYKYYGNNAGLAALESGQLGFRKPKNFNDPFEFSFLSNSEGPHSKIEELKNKINLLRETVAILCLTRTPDNPLMWAHYGQEHTGFVLAYDVSDEFLSSSSYNLIPVTSGDVVYTSTKNPHILNPETMDRIHNIYLSGMGEMNGIAELETQSFARKIFLTKHASWAYEEEVRVVKILDSMFEEAAVYQANERRSHFHLTRPIEGRPGHFAEVIPGLSLFEFKMPIAAVYLGLRNSTSIKTIKAMAPDSRIYKFEMDDKSWNLKRKEKRTKPSARVT